MAAPPRKISWIIPPPELCCLCRQPLSNPDETSSWNGNPAHRECVRIQLIQKDPAFRETDAPDGSMEEAPDPTDTVLSKDDDEGDFG
ncbi:MAG TPA: hypothetical protein VLY85_02835 [Thermoplasmata archaeon]|nr:hypothetical protein [Thermoplasmata archaeon]